MTCSPTLGDGGRGGEQADRYPTENDRAVPRGRLAFLLSGHTGKDLIDASNAAFGECSTMERWQTPDESELLSWRLFNGNSRRAWSECCHAPRSSERASALFAFQGR